VALNLTSSGSRQLWRWPCLQSCWLPGKSGRRRLGYNGAGSGVPWVYTLSDDLFDRPPRPPSPDTLSWAPKDCDFAGNLAGGAPQPSRYSIKDAGAEASEWLNDAAWSKLVCAYQSPLFDTLIAHFFVRAFLAEPIDEFLSHIITIEAALGLQSDYGGKAMPKVGGRRQLGATGLMAARVSALLGARTDGEDYRRLFGIRSAFVHGRTMARNLGQGTIRRAQACSKSCRGARRRCSNGARLPVS